MRCPRCEAKVGSFMGLPPAFCPVCGYNLRNGDDLPPKGVLAVVICPYCEGDMVTFTRDKGRKVFYACPKHNPSFFPGSNG